MTIDTAAALAAILDPNHQIDDWWTPCWTSPDFGGTPISDLPSVCKFNDWYFIGPSDLHTAREHCWRMEDWLKSRDCRILSSINMTYVDCMFDGNIDYENISENDNHAAALRAAVERIANG